MPNWRIDYAPSAKRELAKLPPDVQRRIAPKIEALAVDPYPSGCLKLEGSAVGAWRIRVGDYRVAYVVNEGVLVVLVIKVGNRRDVYRR